MLSSEAMIVWTPNTELYDGLPNKGKIAVTIRPEPAELKVHPMSVGACDHDWNETDFVGRVELMRRYVRQMIEDDQMNEVVILEVLDEIEDFRVVDFRSLR